MRLSHVIQLHCLNMIDNKYRYAMINERRATCDYRLAHGHPRNKSTTEIWPIHMMLVLEALNVRKH